MVVVVARHDNSVSGTSRYNVEVIPWEDWSIPAPWMGLDAAKQHRGARLDVCRYELTLSGDAERFSIAKELLDRTVDEVWQDMKDFLDRVAPVDDEEGVAHV
jgi:D-mannonate dehydratase